MGILQKLFGTTSEKELRAIAPLVDRVESLAGIYAAMSDDRLRAATPELRQRLANGETLDDILPDAFAAVREAAKRTVGMYPYRVQLEGGIVLHQGRIAEMKTGEGKACTVDTKIPTPNGWKRAGDIRVGDYLFDRLGKPTMVTGVFPQGKKQVCEVELRDGRIVRCNEEHLWQVNDNRRAARDNRVMTTKEMMDAITDDKAKRGYNFSIPMSSAVEYAEKEFELDPYVLGCFLGNGCKSGQNGLLTGTNSYEKYIPEEYKLGSIEQRWALMQGLMDTDGSIYEDDGSRFNIRFSTTSERLRDDIMELAYSLGCSASYGLQKAPGVEHAKHQQYQVAFNVPNEIKHNFFRVKYKKDLAIKAANFKKNKRYDRISISDIRKTDEFVEQVCFTVDNEEHLFLVGNYVVTHNTLVTTLPAYLNALAGKGVHVITVNDYLAKRDSEWMGKIYKFMGLSVGLVVHGVTPRERKAAYDADITYGTNNEFGFDYLRDNMAIHEQELVQRGHPFAIVDEVDSILIDEARTPLIISGRGENPTELYTAVDRFVSALKCKRVASVDDKEQEDVNEGADYIVDEKARIATLTARGITRVEQHFNVENLADPDNASLSHFINQSIRAHGVMKRDIDYVVRDGQVIIVDEFTGRLMFGRRYNEGLHQAIEAKEGVEIANESKTLASITFQNYFRLYDKLSGMTGTAMTEEEEFGSIYNLDIVEIPTHKPVIRKDNADAVYKTEAAKYRAIVKQIEECHAKGQPVLVGTTSIEKSEELSAVLRRRGIKHNVLNAKNHEKEAEIIAQAGKLGAVTVATNMAGRGTDIMLGGNAEFLAKSDLRGAGLSDDLIAEATGFTETDNEDILDARKRFAKAEAKYKTEIAREAERVRSAGGLFIIGTERHESRRIDNQLRGRSGRQGDPGETRFYLSMEDDLMRRFGGDRLASMAERLGVDEDMPIDAKMLSSSIENAQKSVESRNFQMRKAVLEYDDVMNKQRELIYEQRRQVLSGKDMRESIRKMLDDVIRDTITENLTCPGECGVGAFYSYIDEGCIDVPGWNKIREKFRMEFVGDDLALSADELATMNGDDLAYMLRQKAEEVYDRKEQELGAPLMRELERVMMLRVVDEYWMDHLDNMTELRQGVGLRAYGQEKPTDVYKREGFDMFEEMVIAIRAETVRRVFLARVRVNVGVQRRRVAKVTGESGGDGSVKRQPQREVKKVGRNELCPCGSGRKWKKCTCAEYHDT